MIMCWLINTVMIDELIMCVEFLVIDEPVNYVMQWSHCTFF